MARERYREWLARGRAHQAAGRAIDAMLCYQRALREDSPGAGARIRLGVIAWQLGKPSEAIEHWRAVVAARPGNLTSLRVLADAYAELGVFDAALDMSRQALTAVPDDARTVGLATILLAARGEFSAQRPTSALMQALATRPAWPLVLLAAVIEALATANAPGAATDTESEALAEVRAAVVTKALEAPVTRENVDALRTIALALLQVGDRDGAQAFGDRYAQNCEALFRTAVPLTWPLRSAGPAPRVGVLHVSGTATSDTLVATLASAFGPGECEWTALKLSDLPSSADDAARVIAALDLDVLIDIAGLAHPSGPLRALRPARRVVELGYASGSERLISEIASEIRRFDPRSADLNPANRSDPISVATAHELASRRDAAVRAHHAGDSDSARAGYDWVLERQPGHASTLYLRAVLDRDRGRIDDALTDLRAAVDLAPGFDDARTALANLLLDRGDFQGAAATASEGIARSSQAATLWRALGQARLKIRDAVGAAAAFAEALVREPTHGETHYNYGVALQMQQDLPGAARAYQRALAFRPDLNAAEFNLGVVFDQQGHSEAAITAFGNVLSRAPTDVAAYKALGESLLAAGRIDAWVANFERFDEHCHDHLSAAVQALEVCAYRGDYRRLDLVLDGLRNGRYTAGTPDDILDALQQLIYLLHFFDVELEVIGRYERTHAELARRVYGEAWACSTPRRPGRLRIGYLSGDFRNHVMGKMMWEAVRHHDHERFEVFGYAATDAHDAWTDRFRSAFTRFDTVASLSDDDAARRIAGDDLDVLVDLSTHTKGARPGILARKPARVQITHVASAGTTALSTIDFKLTDRHADPEDASISGVEGLLPMEGCVYPWRRVEAAPGAAFDRDTLRIPEDMTVIGAFSAPLKLSQRCLAVWREVLARIPRSVLAFSPTNPALRSTYARLVANSGIDARRIVFIAQGRDEAENQARYRAIDFVLDPMPYGGVNGTMEALGMGVPLVTLVGRRHAERTSYSILANLGVTATTARTGPEYIAIAERLATDTAFMREVRSRIAEGIAHSSLTDMPAHTRNLESAYVAALAQRAPEALAEARASDGGSRRH